MYIILIILKFLFKIFIFFILFKYSNNVEEELVLYLLVPQVI